MFHERDDGLRWALGVQRVAVGEVAAVGDAVEGFERFRIFGACESDFDARFVARAML